MNSMSRTLSATLVITLGAAALVGCGASSSAKLSADSAPPPPPVSYEPGQYPSAPEPTSAGRASVDTGGDFGGPASIAPSTPPMEERSSEGEARRRDTAPDPSSRPGLGTEWGETRQSRISTVAFVRADARSPFGTASLFYNDAEGARSMSSTDGFRRFTGANFTVASGAVSVGLRDEHGSFLSGFVAGGKDFVIGEAGRSYKIVLKNKTSNRVEAVVSVDGLDVLDGREASFAKRGYLIDAGGELEIDGFRQSTETVASFRFGSVRGSYANQKHGETRNVGVIGVALFHERGTSPFPWTPDEVARRQSADPFPARFATPPN